MIDRRNRQRLSDLLSRASRNELTGWEIHAGAEDVDSTEDEAVDSILLVLEVHFAGWETVRPSLDADTRALLKRCAAFLRSDLALERSSKTFLSVGPRRRRRFDTEAFMEMVDDGVWPFSSENQARDFGA